MKKQTKPLTVEEKQLIQAGMADLVRIASSLIGTRNLHIQFKELDEEYEQKVNEVEEAYKKKKSEPYKERDRMIQNFSQFWFNVFLSHPELSQKLTDTDKMILEYLETVHVESPNEVGYKITLGFKDNPFFENKNLVLTYLDETIPTSKIQWKSGVANLNSFRFFNDSPWVELDDSDEDFSAEERADFLENVVGRIATDLWKNAHKYYFSKMRGDKDKKGRDDASNDKP